MKLDILMTQLHTTLVLVHVASSFFFQRDKKRLKIFQKTWTKHWNVKPLGSIVFKCFTLLTYKLTKCIYSFYIMLNC